MKKIAVVLSGCGVYDGAEIHESVLTLLALARKGASVVCVAPDIAQRHVVNHLNGEIDPDEDRNVLEESARICRGQIKRVSHLKPSEYDAVIFCGGFGAAKNLSSLAFDGLQYDVDAVIVDLIQEAYDAGKPQGFMCIAPALAARALRNKGIKLTIGNDADTVKALQKQGAQHIECAVNDIVVDATNKIVSTPAYMLAETILEAEAGINRLVDKIVEMA